MVKENKTKYSLLGYANFIDVMQLNSAYFIDYNGKIKSCKYFECSG